jgi:4-aminobutyrate aminotransferase-like enzyme
VQGEVLDVQAGFVAYGPDAFAGTEIGVAPDLLAVSGCTG